MLRGALAMMREKTHDAAHERTKSAMRAFLALWLLCVLTSTVWHSLILSVQGLLIFHHCVSLGGAIVARVWSEQTRRREEKGGGTYPLCFGVYRVRSVTCLAGAIFVAFGCVTVVVEGFHTAMHTHHRDLKVLAITGALHAACLLRYRREVLALDRICGRPANRHGISPDEEQLFRLSSSVSLQLGGSVLGGGQHVEMGGVRPSRLPASPSAVLSAGGFGRVSTLASLFSSMRLLLPPAACLTVSVFVYMLHNNLPDTLVTLVVASYYCSVAVSQGRHTVWTLANNAVRDPICMNAVDRALRAVQLLDGVLQLHSSAFFLVNPCEMAGVVRLRLMSGADAAAVSASSRKLLTEVVKYAYVECFFPNTRAGEEVLSRGFGPPSHFSVGVDHEQHHHHHHSHSHSHSHGRDCHHLHEGEDHAHGNGHGESVDVAVGVAAPSPLTHAAPELPHWPNHSNPSAAPAPLPLPARPVWDRAPHPHRSSSSTTDHHNENGRASPYRTPLVPPPSLLRPPVPALAATAAGVVPLPAGQPAEGSLLAPLSQARGPPPGSSLVQPRSQHAAPSPLPAPPAQLLSSSLPTLSPAGGAEGAFRASSGATRLNVPRPSDPRPPLVFTPFRQTTRTDKDV